MSSSQIKSIAFKLNGRLVQEEVQSRLNLADFLRQQCHLTGTHVGCEHGVCGACTPEKGLSILQESFWFEHGLQCGFCTPGVLISLTQLLKDNANPSSDEIRDVLSGHLCRCTGYQNIVRACSVAAKRLRDEANQVAHMAKPGINHGG